MNRQQSNMSKHGISSRTSSNSFSLPPYGSLSCSDRNFYRVSSSKTYYTNDVHTTARATPISTIHHKSSGHQTILANNRSNKTDILDRKAFISLEKSINWQPLLNDASSSPSLSTSPMSFRQCSVIIPPKTSQFNSPTLFTDQVKEENLGEAGSQATRNMFCSGQLKPPSPTNNDTTNKCRSHQVSVDQVSLGSNSCPQSTSEQEFTLPGMKDVPAWLKCKFELYIM